jgi:hypothetical protein
LLQLASCKVTYLHCRKISILNNHVWRVWELTCSLETHPPDVNGE